MLHGFPPAVAELLSLGSYHTMRIKVIIGLTALLTALGFLLLSRSSSAPRVSLAFKGYSEDGTKALFVVTNHSRHKVCVSLPMVEFTPDSKTESDQSDLMGSMLIGDWGELPLAGHKTAVLPASVPSGQGRWRVAVRCRTYRMDRPTSWQDQLQWLVQAPFRGRDTNDEFTVLSEEIGKSP